MIQAISHMLALKSRKGDSPHHAQQVGVLLLTLLAPWIEGLAAWEGSGEGYQYEVLRDEMRDVLLAVNNSVRMETIPFLWRKA